jgi:hypothetical protein
MERPEYTYSHIFALPPKPAVTRCLSGSYPPPPPNCLIIRQLRGFKVLGFLLKLGKFKAFFVIKNHKNRLATVFKKRGKEKYLSKKTGEPCKAEIAGIN